MIGSESPPRRQKRARRILYVESETRESRSAEAARLFAQLEKEPTEENLHKLVKHARGAMADTTGETKTETREQENFGLCSPWTMYANEQEGCSCLSEILQDAHTPAN